MMRDAERPQWLDWRDTAMDHAVHGVYAIAAFRGTEGPMILYVGQSRRGLMRRALTHLGRRGCLSAVRALHDSGAFSLKIAVANVETQDYFAIYRAEQDWIAKLSPAFNLTRLGVSDRLALRERLLREFYHWVLRPATVPA